MDLKNSGEKLDAEVKARIRPEHKRALQRIARRRDIALSDVAREAFRMYLNNEKKKPAPAPNVLQGVAG
jgi:hypothetical protein